MTTLSKSFRSLASQKFEFLVRDFGFGPPEVRSQGWQFTELLYRGKRVAIRVSLDNEEQVLVYVHLMTDGIMPPRDDVSRTFLVDAVAPIWSDRAPKWGFISTEPELDERVAQSRWPLSVRELHETLARRHCGLFHTRHLHQMLRGLEQAGFLRLEPRAIGPKTYVSSVEAAARSG